MKVLPTKSRTNYIATQIKRSRKKFSYCKVSARDPIRHFQIINEYARQHSLPPVTGPVICLGTRNGREVDLFRAALHRPILSRTIAISEVRHHGFLSPLDFSIGRGRSDLKTIDEQAVVGVEINPDAKRQDVLIGSFDDMPANWANRFHIVYSNSFDQSQDPERTATEWLRITKPGGYLIIAFGINKEPSETDPVGNLTLSDIEKLFPGELVHYTPEGTLYAEAIIRKPTI